MGANGFQNHRQQKFYYVQLSGFQCASALPSCQFYLQLFILNSNLSTNWLLQPVSTVLRFGTIPPFPDFVRLSNCDVTSNATPRSSGQPNEEKTNQYMPNAHGPL